MACGPTWQRNWLLSSLNTYSFREAARRNLPAWMPVGTGRIPSAPSSRGPVPREIDGITETTCTSVWTNTFNSARIWERNPFMSLHLESVKVRRIRSGGAFVPQIRCNLSSMTFWTYYNTARGPLRLRGEPSGRPTVILRPTISHISKSAMKMGGKQHASMARDTS